MFRSLLFIQAAKAQPPAQATRPPHYIKGARTPPLARPLYCYLAVPKAGEMP
jgi:hypothetical protein